MKKKLAIFLILIMLLSVVTGCGGKKTDTDLAKEKIETVLKAMKSGDFKEIEKMTGYDAETQEGDEEETQKMMKLLFSDMSWSFVSGEVKEGKGDLVYKIKSKDLGELFLKIFAGAMAGQLNTEDEASLMKFVEDTVKNISPSEKEISFSVSKEGEEFKFSNIEDAMAKAMGLDMDLFGGGMENGIEDSEDPDESGDTQNSPSEGSDSEETKEISIGETVQFNGHDFTVKSFQKVGTWTEGETAIKMVYAWKNNGTSEDSALFNFTITGYQKGVEVDSAPLSDDIDFGIAQKDVQPGVEQENCEAGFVVKGDDVLEIKIRAAFSIDSPVLMIKVNPAEVKE